MRKPAFLSLLTKPNDGMHPTRISMDFIVNLAAAALNARRVMLGVRRFLPQPNLPVEI
jgi:hypothetical protein